MANMKSIMSLKRNISRGISEVFALSRMITGNRPGLRVLMYHSVNSNKLHDQSNDPFGIFTVHPRLFNIQIKPLIENPSFSIVSLDKGYTSICTDRITITITFDDGYKDNLYTVAPILVMHGIPFTVFVTSEFIKNEKPDFLTPDELRELSLLPGVDIGAHGATHTPLTDLDDSMLVDELVSSKQYLEDVIGKEVTAISYPHGAVDLRVRDAVINAGYKVGASSRINVNNNLCDPLVLCRSVILANDSERIFMQKIHGDWDWHRWKEKDYGKIPVYSS